MLHICGVRLMLQILFYVGFSDSWSYLVIDGSNFIPFWLLFSWRSFNVEFVNFLRRCLLSAVGRLAFMDVLWLLTETSDQESCRGLFECQ